MSAQAAVRDLIEVPAVDTSMQNARSLRHAPRSGDGWRTSLILLLVVAAITAIHKSGEVAGPVLACYEGKASPSDVFRRCRSRCYDNYCSVRLWQLTRAGRCHKHGRLTELRVCRSREKFWRERYLYRSVDDDWCIHRQCRGRPMAAACATNVRTLEISRAATRERSASG